MMRRAFIRSLVGALAAGSSPVAKAQRTGVWRIGVPFAGPGTPASNLGALKKSFEGLGYVEDVNAAFVVPLADGWIERLPELAAELVGLGVDVLITGGSEATRAAKQASASNVIVFPDRVIRSRRGSSAASRAPVPIFPYCRSRPVRRSSTSAAEWFPDASFDGAYAQHVTMNVPDRFRFFAEACRVVRTGGFFALSRCLSPSDRQLPEGPSSCSRQVRSRLPQRHRGGSPFIQQTAISRRLSTVRYAANRTGRMEGEMTAAPAPMSAT